MAQPPGTRSLERLLKTNSCFQPQARLSPRAPWQGADLAPSSGSRKLEEHQPERSVAGSSHKVLTPPWVISCPSPASGPLHLLFPLSGPGSRQGWFCLIPLSYQVSYQVSWERSSLATPAKGVTSTPTPKLSPRFTFLVALMCNHLVRPLPRHLKKVRSVRTGTCSRW